ncbi:uncharacterized protein LOC143235809 [Tachypleus tridentatus]|uniref:uncharacterized protein LOC143235809 n=1 Tax=Tachypleus tridentatus TaxID=6853 RepID=UPI003FCF52B4
MINLVLILLDVKEELEGSAEHAVAKGDTKQSSPQSPSGMLRCRPRNVQEGIQVLLEDDNGTYPEDPSQSKDIFAMDMNGSVILSTDGNTFDGDSDDEVSSIDITKSLYFSLFTCLFRLVKKGSYIGTLIIMMTWSITYHSWLTFILLLWSCVVWMLPNSRQACLRTSPFFVAYAESLLLLQYIYGLNLRDCELPDKIETVNLEQLGLMKYYELSYQPLAVKIMYTIVFWVTLRQFVEEKRLEANRDISERVMMERYNVFNCRYPALHHRLSVATSKGGLYACAA